MFERAVSPRGERPVGFLGPQAQALCLIAAVPDMALRAGPARERSLGGEQSLPEVLRKHSNQSTTTAQNAWEPTRSDEQS